MTITSQQVCKDLLALLGHIKQGLAVLAESENLTQMQLGTLYVLKQRGSVAMGEMAQGLHCDPSNVTGIIDRLMAQNLVTRQENPQDRRAKTISLTPAGERTIDAIYRNLPNEIGCALLTAQERSALHAIAQKLLSS